ncbi:MAG TPA: adenosylcobalamin-dependent ribonucleoside-diphosphate reductase, partial [Candidatus Manganitrophaceae bacterium]|nr:adenosylcobalamin-dependent ribonucleoside-diphosphate reductase [Candidatus Manganitrophaceae bacterium]
MEITERVEKAEGEEAKGNKGHSSPLSPNALRVLEKRYLAKNKEGKVIETPEALFRRVANNMAQADRYYDPQADVAAVEEEFYQLISQLKFLPNSPTLMNAGRDLQQLSACFVLPVEDSMESIFETVKQAAIIHKTGGGTGFSFSRLRPKDDVVRSTGGVASGPVSFMKVFNHATEAVKQGGTRRGANMGILRVDHPDILEFIECKADTSQITNFNISVAITDRFMEAFEKGEEYDLISPRDKKPAGKLPAKLVMDKIAEQACRTGEPGLFFIDVTNRTNPTPHVADMEATNPCGEQPLLPYESCNLGSLNLELHLKQVDGKYRIDWEALEASIRTSIHFLDNVIDMNRYPIKEIEEITKANRKIGLGVMGFSRMLFKLEIPYNSEEGIEMGQTIMGFIRRIGYDESARLAEKRGVYANWEGSLHQKRGERVRNSYVTTVAPTGTISMIADTSGGCEPEFSLIWYKNVMGGDHLPYVLDYFIDVAKREGFYSDDLLDKILKNHGSVQGIVQVPARWQRVFVTSHGISPEWHVKMQAAFQASSDSAVSKTINLPSHATAKEVKEAYLLAYRLGCKGITVYRDGARPDQVMNVGESKKAEAKTESKKEANGNGQAEAPAGGHGKSEAQPAPAEEEMMQPIMFNAPRSRPEIMTGTTTRKRTSCGDL